MALSKIDFNTAEEKEAVEAVFQNAVQCLSEADRELPAIANILPLLRRGIGIHHSGLLPILKELIEILFQVGRGGAAFAADLNSLGVHL